MEEKKIVLPGDKIAEGRIYIPNTFSDGKATYAASIGMLDLEGRYLALESRYKPVAGDQVVGIITDAIHAGYRVDLNMPSEGFIPARSLRTELQLSDFVICRIKSVGELGEVDLGEVRQLPSGQICGFPSAKVPRLIGRKNSMIALIKAYTDGDILVGTNGYVWVSEKSNIPLVMKTLEVVKQKAHKTGLTDEITSMLSKATGRVVSVPTEPVHEHVREESKETKKNDNSDDNVDDNNDNKVGNNDNNNDESNE